MSGMFGTAGVCFGLPQRRMFWLTGNHGNLESTEKSESAENLESTEKMTLRL